MYKYFDVFAKSTMVYKDQIFYKKICSYTDSNN